MPVGEAGKSAWGSLRFSLVKGCNRRTGASRSGGTRIRLGLGLG